MGRSEHASRQWSRRDVLKFGGLGLTVIVPALAGCGAPDARELTPQDYFVQFQRLLMANTNAAAAVNRLDLGNPNLRFTPPNPEYLDPSERERFEVLLKNPGEPFAAFQPTVTLDTYNSFDRNKVHMNTVIIEAYVDEDGNFRPKKTINPITGGSSDPDIPRREMKRRLAHFLSSATAAFFDASPKDGEDTDRRSFIVVVDQPGKRTQAQTYKEGMIRLVIQSPLAA
jgi:hypothetical protein